MSKTELVGPDDCNGCQMDARQGITRPHNHGCPHALRMGEYCHGCVCMLISKERERHELTMRDRDFKERELQSAIETVVLACLVNRKHIPVEHQAAALRDRLLDQFDPLMMVTSRLKKEGRYRP